MNKISILLASLLGAVAISAQAGELYTPAQYDAPASTLTRAQVKQSVLQARKAGELNHNDVDLPSENELAFGKTRAAVKSEVLAARATGGLAHDDVDLPAVAKGSELTRQQVRDEYVASRKAINTAPGRNTIDY
jgi:hypothetical protein